MPKSRLEIAYSSLRHKIIYNDYAPGMLLSENELAAEFQMSRTPIRTALSRLEAEGYVASLKNRGVLVKDIVPREVLELLELVVSLQIFVIDTASRRDYPFNLLELSSILAEQQSATREEDYPRYLECLFAFIASFVAIGRNQTMVSLIHSSKDKIIQAAISNFKSTPHQKHFSGTQYTEALLEAMKGNDWAKTRGIVEQFGSSIRQRAVLDEFSF